MIKDSLNIIKVGGAIVENEESLQSLLMSLSSLKGRKILVHGGGKIATEMAAKPGKAYGVETQMIDGRRITSAEMLKVVTMVYGGLVNKNLVARLQALGVNAIGLTGADLNLIMSVKRPVQPINFGYVGDIKYVNAKALENLLESGAVPVLAPLTHDKEGSMLNTNADTIASSAAMIVAVTTFSISALVILRPSIICILLVHSGRDEGPERPVKRDSDHNQFRFRPDGRRRHHLRGYDPETPERL